MAYHRIAAGTSRGRARSKMKILRFRAYERSGAGIDGWIRMPFVPSIGQTIRSSKFSRTTSDGGDCYRVSDVQYDLDTGECTIILAE